MNRLLQDYAATQATRRPDKTALAMQDFRLTYGQLDQQSNRLARVLAEHGCRPGDRVCLFLSKSPAAVVAMHAILKAGGIYVPIDLASPPLRVGRIVESCQPKIILVDQPATPLESEWN